MISYILYLCINAFFNPTCITSEDGGDDCEKQDIETNNKQSIHRHYQTSTNSKDGSDEYHHGDVHHRHNRDESRHHHHKVS